MSSPEARSYTADHPHSHHHNTPITPKTTHRLSLSSPLPHLTTLTHAPAVFLGTLHRHERELVINHQARAAKKEANAAIEKYEAGFSSPTSSTSTSPSSSTTHSGSTAAARAAMNSTATEEEQAEWAAIVAARAAATRRSATLDLEKEMAEERRRKVLEEIEAEGRGEF